MKKGVLYIGLFLCYIGTLSQSFERHYVDTLDIVLLSAVELNNKGFLIAGVYTDRDSSGNLFGHGFLWRIDSMGTLMKEVYLGDSIESGTLKKIIKINDNRFIVVGGLYYVHTDWTFLQKNKPFLMIIDSNLNIIKCIVPLFRLPSIQ